MPEPQLPVGKQLSDVLPIEQQIVGLQHGHQAGVLERYQIAGDRAPGEDDETPLRPGADQLAEGLPLHLALHLLKIVDQQDLPVLRQGVQRERRIVPTQAEDGTAGE